MKLKICLMGLLCLYFSTNAQNNVAPPTIKIGDKMPDISLAHVINSHYKGGKLSDFKGKLILIDFWSTHCGSCIASFPELDSLQQLFPDKLQVLLVNPYDSEKQIKLLLARLSSWSPHKLKLPVVYQDTVIAYYFKFRTIPACAWISPDGRLIAFTEKDQVTAANIEKILRGETVALPVKDDYAVTPNNSKQKNANP